MVTATRSLGCPLLPSQNMLGSSDHVNGKMKPDDSYLLPKDEDRGGSSQVPIIFPITCKLVRNSCSCPTIFFLEPGSVVWNLETDGRFPLLFRCERSSGQPMFGRNVPITRKKKSPQKSTSGSHAAQVPIEKMVEKKGPSSRGSKELISCVVKVTASQDIGS